MDRRDQPNASGDRRPPLSVARGSSGDTFVSLALKRSSAGRPAEDPDRAPIARSKGVYENSDELLQRPRT